MKKTFIVDRVEITLSEEKLKEMLKEMQKPVYTMAVERYKCLTLFKDGISQPTILELIETNLYNLSTMSRDMARCMDDLMSTKEVFNKFEIGYSISYSNSHEQVVVESTLYSTARKHFKTREIAEQAAKLINDSEYIEEYMKKEIK